MTQIASPPFQAGQFVGESPATGIVAAVASDGTVKVLTAWDPVQGDVTYTAAAGSAGGGGTRVHRFGSAVVVSGIISATALITVSGTTSYVYMIAQNTSGNTLVGVEGSVGGTLTPASLPYASLIGSNQATALQLFTSNVIRLTIVAGGAVIVGTDPGGSELLRVGGGLRVSGIVAAPSGVTLGTAFLAPDASSGLIIAGKTGSTNDITIQNGAGATALRVPTGTVDAAIAGRIITGDPGAGSGGWRLGQFKAASVTLDTAHYVEVNIDGGVRKLLVAT